MGRFINADSLASTGQGIIGNNMFAYCNNSPASCYDPYGYWGMSSGITNPNAMTYKGGEKRFYLPDAKRKAIEQEKQRKNPSNRDETIVLQAEKYAFYKGALVVRHSSDFLTSWSLFGVIFLNRNVSSAETLKHEYGHFLQEQEFGCGKYISAVFIPSAAYNLLSRKNPVLNDNYYNMPWEYDADIRGGAQRDHAPWSETISTAYFEILRKLP